MNTVEAAKDIFSYALDAVMPGHLLERRIQRNGDLIELGGKKIDLRNYKNIYLLGAGKASAAMALVLENLLGNKLSEGICVVKYGHVVPLRKTRIIEAGHPIPDLEGVKGGKAIVEMAQKATKEDLVICVISGGGSALLVAPHEDIPLKDLQEFSSELLRAGATINELNTLRKHLSQVKGGRLARLICPARTISLIISDVIGDPLDIIASGPTVPDPSTFQDAIEILERYSLVNAMPGTIRSILERGIKGEVEETPKAGEPLFKSVYNYIIGNNQYAVLAASEKAKLLGYTPCILSTGIFGESREIAHSLVAAAREVIRSGHPVSPPACLILGGETTVTVKGTGKGGRCTEFALSASMEMNEKDRFTILAAGTDGTDGPTDAAGAFVTAETIPMAKEKGLNPFKYLENNDSYTFFKKTGNLITTGPTLTNVMDIIIAVIE